MKRPAKDRSRKSSKRPGWVRRRTAPKAAPKGKSPPVIHLGAMAPNGISASMYGLVERGVGRRPGIARSIRGTIEFRFRENFAPLRMTFTTEEVRIDDVLYQDDDSEKPGLVISGSLPDIVQLASAPLISGIPKPTNERGRTALARIVNGKVRIEGNPLIARRLLRLLEI